MNYSNSVDQFIIPRNKKIHIGVFLFVIILSVLTSCEKDELDKLPSETMSGRNTFGCLINGEAFTPEKTTWTDVPLKSYYYQNEDLIQISVFNSENILNLFIWKPQINTNYKFDRNYFEENNMSNLVTGCGDVDEVFLDSEALNILTFSNFDIENRIVSGTFNLEFMGDKCSEGNYIVSEGRFDLSFSMY